MSSWLSWQGRAETIAREYCIDVLVRHRRFWCGQPLGLVANPLPHQPARKTRTLQRFIPRRTQLEAVKPRQH